MFKTKYCWVIISAILIFCCSAGIGNAQTPGQDSSLVLSQEPEPLTNIQDSLTYPTEAKRAGLEGKVVVKALIEKDGKVSKALVLNSDFEVLGKSAREAVLKTQFSSAIQNGKPVRVWVILTVQFRLTQPGSTTEFKDTSGRFQLSVPQRSHWEKMADAELTNVEIGLMSNSPRAFLIASAKDTGITLHQLDSTLRARMDTSTTKVLKDEPYTLDGRECKHFEIQCIINGVPQIMSIFAYAGKGWTMKFAIWATKEIVSKNPDVLLAPVAFLHILRP